MSANNGLVVFFDVDGLLVDSEKVYNECWINAAASMGYSLSKIEACKLRSLDSSLARKLFFEWYQDDSAYDLVRAQRKKIMFEKLQSVSLKAKPGVDYILNILDSKGIDYAIVTSAPIARAKSYLKTSGINHEFKNIVSTELVKKGKPYPDVYQFALESLKLNGNQVLALEDSPNGLLSAHQAGCRTVMIPDLTDFNSELEAYVDYKFDNLIECADFINEHY
mgnify:CR=1 FL=1